MSIAKHKPRCFIDVEIGGVSVGRVIFELYADKCPKTAENFRTLCTGEGGIGKKTGKPLHYKGTVFHRVVKDFMVQSGDFSNNNGTGGESIYGPTFPDENLEMKHEVPYLLSMANRGPNTNSSQFFITTQPAQHLDGIHVVFGHVISGQGVVKQIEGLPVDRMSRPLQDARIANCGELVPKTKTKEEKKKEQDSSSSEEEKEEKKKKKKKQKKKSKSDKESDMEEGELKEPELPLHPLATVTHMKEDEIPDVPKNKFLDRGGGDKDKDKDHENNRDKRRGNYDARDRWNGNNRNGRDRMKNSTTKSGRKIKGRGSLRYRTPSRSRSRSRTPPHWRQEQKRTISLKEYEEKEKDKREHEEELRRREEERKKRHEERERKEKEAILERELKEMERQLNMGPSLTEVKTKESDEASPQTRSPELQPPGVNMDMDDLDYEAMETTENVEEELKANQLEEAAGLPLSADKRASKAANGHESDSSGQALDSEALEDLRCKDKARSKLPSPESEDIRQRFHSREEAGVARGAVKQPVTGNSKVPADFDSRSPSRSKTPLYAHLLEKETPEGKVPPTVAGAGAVHHAHPKTRVEEEPVETIPLLINRKEAHVDVRKSKSPDRAARNRSASKDKDNNKDRDVKRSRRSSSREREHHQHRVGNRDHRDQGTRDRRDRGDRRRKSRSRSRNRSRRH